MFVNNDELLGASFLDKFRKTVKKVAKPITKTVQKITSKGPLETIKKAVRKVAAVQAGAMTVGLVKPKALGIKSKSGKQMYRVGRGIAIAAGAVAAAIVAGPAIGTAFTKFGVVLKSLAPKALAKLGPGVASKALEQMVNQGVPPDEAARLLEEDMANLVEANSEQEATQAGMMGTLPIVLIGGAVVYMAYTLTQKKR